MFFGRWPDIQTAENSVRNEFIHLAVLMSLDEITLCIYVFKRFKLKKFTWHLAPASR